MFRRTALTVGLVSACLWGLLLVAQPPRARSDGLTAASAQPYRPVTPLGVLIAAHTEQLDELNALLRASRVETSFSTLERKALLLAELSNLIAFRAPTDSQRARASELRDYALTIAQAATRQDLP